MEKIDIEDPDSTASFPEAGEWKKRLEELVEGFHQKGLVHGDLRLANFVFTKSKNPWKMPLIDFDWGGREGVAEFPHERLIGELGVSNDKLSGRKITKEHDKECLSRVLGWLGRHTPTSPVRWDEGMESNGGHVRRGVSI